MMKSIKKAISTALCALFVSLGIISAGVFPSTAAGLPAKFQPDIKTPVLDQKNNPLCWAYSGPDLLSINAIKNGYAKNGASVFSAQICLGILRNILVLAHQYIVDGLCADKL